MKAIPMFCLAELASAMPGCLISAPNDAGCSFILDKDNNKAGAIHWHAAQVTIYGEYEYADEVIASLGVDRFVDASPEFDYSTAPANKKLEQEINNHQYGRIP